MIQKQSLSVLVRALHEVLLLKLKTNFYKVIIKVYAYN